MDGQTIFNFGTTIIGVLIGWILRIIWSEIKLLQSNQQAIEKGYVQKEDYRIDIAEIKGMLGRIFDRLDRQADKQ